jgi:hypothetical protein
MYKFFAVFQRPSSYSLKRYVHINAENWTGALNEALKWSAKQDETWVLQSLSVIE